MQSSNATFRLLHFLLASVALVTDNMFYTGGFARPWDGSSPITVGSACSGWNSEIFALEFMNIAFSHVFSCDVAKHVKKLAQYLHAAQDYFDDIMDPMFLNIASAVQVFVAGWPCQPWSRAGQRQGLNDSGDGGRGLVIVFVLAYIFTRRPVLFILENVVVSGTKFENCFAAIVHALKMHTDAANEPCYNVSTQCLNARERSSLPQNRHRTFIVGLRRDCQRDVFEWPGVVPMRNLLDLLDEPKAVDLKPFPGNLPPESSGTKRRNVLAALEKLTTEGHDPMTIPAVVDHGSTNLNFAIGYSPCITKARASTHGHWITCLQKEMSINDMLRLQGVPEWRVRGWKNHIATGNFLGIIGNAIPVPLLERIFMRALYAAGLVNSRIVDKYESVG